MYLTRVMIDTSKRMTMRALASPSIFHGAAESSFEGERKRRLWRIDNLNGNYYMLLLSEDRPELSGFCEQFSSENKWETVDYDKLLRNITAGDIKQFRLTANPTISVCDEKGKRGKVLAHITAEHQKQWLIEKGKSNGFILNDDSFDIVQCKWKRFYKSGSKAITLLSVTYEGILEITDAELFRNALTKGIGRGRAYGMGLMTIMKVKSE